MPTRQKTRVSAFCFIVLMVTAVAWATPVPDTGQTKYYNNTVEIPYPSAGQPFYGQDGNYSINPMSYTKLDGNGNDLPDSSTSWLMVRDNVTSLIWELKTNMDGFKYYNDPTMQIILIHGTTAIQPPMAVMQEQLAMAGTPKILLKP